MNPPPLVVRENVALDACTTLGVGGAARFFTSAGTEAEVRLALEFASARRFVVAGAAGLIAGESLVGVAFAL